MKSMFSYMGSILLGALTVLICIAIFIVNIQATEIRSAFNNYVEQIEASDFNENVILWCMNSAAENGWTLELSNETTYEELRSYRVTLRYNIEVPIIGIDVRSGTIEGYAK